MEIFTNFDLALILSLFQFIKVKKITVVKIYSSNILQ
jgi:hypothetical protein